MVKVYNEYPNFHCLLGNHELAQLNNTYVYKYGVNQTLDFLDHIREKAEREHKRYWELKEYYLNILRGFEIAVITDNNILCLHSGANTDYVDYLKNHKLTELDVNNEDDFHFVEELLWSRPYDDFIEETIARLLTYTGADYLVCGHTPMNGLHILGDALIMDSSFCTEKKYYLEFNTNTEFKNVLELLKKTKQFRG